MAFMFEKLEVYQKAVSFPDQVAELTQSFPRGFGFLADQLNRAALSIATNLAEGNGRFTKPDRKNFFTIGRGSVQECEARTQMTLKRMDNVLIVVDDLEATKAFFIELGLKLEGETAVEGPLIGQLIGLKDVRATLAMMRTPDGQGIELDKFHTPDAIRFGPVDAPVNTLGIRRVMFAVEDIDAVVARMRAHGAELIGEMQYENSYRLAYIRGPEGIIVALAEQLG